MPVYQRFAACAGLMVLAACSSGGGASTTASSTPASGSATTTITTTTTTPGATIGAPLTPIFAQDILPNVPHSFATASGTTPNFTTSLPPNGTQFALFQTGFTASPGQVTGRNFGEGSVLTVTGTQTVNGQPQAILQLSVPDLGVTAANLSPNGTVTLPDGRQLSLTLSNLNYSLFGAWGVSPAQVGETNATTSLFISGYQTPVSGIPTGTAQYSGNGATTGGVNGIAVAPSGSGVAVGSLSGTAQISVNFSSATVAGVLNLSVTPNGSTTSSNWNAVGLQGTLSGSSLSGVTASQNTPPAGSLSFDASSTGTFSGALFGPNAQELGAVWTLHDPTGQGKTAIGVIGATATTP
jgi:hypothetical protein